ncbi:MAG: hypothetical protein ACI9DC_001842 [Gammaproteobacteria bacterium]|jgi:hypothetical protein
MRPVSNLSEIGFSPLLTAEQGVYYARFAQAGEEFGRRRMIESNLRLVVKISRRYMNCGLALLDRTQEGHLGLIRAVPIERRADAERRTREPNAPRVLPDCSLGHLTSLRRPHHFFSMASARMSFYS